MFTFDPLPSFVKAVSLSAAAGVGFALVAAALIFIGSRCLPPRIARGQVWIEWRRRRMVWVLALAGGASASVAAGDAICRAVALKQLYWLIRADEVIWTCRLGAACGYLIVLLLFTGLALAARMRAREETGTPRTN